MCPTTTSVTFRAGALMIYARRDGRRRALIARSRSADAHVDPPADREREERVAFAAGEAAADREDVAVEAVVHGVGADASRRGGAS